MKHLALAITLLFAACTRSTPHDHLREGRNALGRGDALAAAEAFEHALTSLPPSDTSALHQARMGRVEAWCVIDPDRAVSEFLELADTTPPLPERDYGMVAGRLETSGHGSQAIHVLDAGLRHHPDSSLTSLMERYIEKAQSTGDPESVAALQTLGYIGD